MKRALIPAVQAIHTAAIIFVMLGWAIPSPTAWAIHLAFIPLMFLQWQILNGECILSRIEHRLRGRPADFRGEENFFIKKVFAAVRLAPSPRTLDFVAKGLPVAAGAISAGRLFL